MLTSCLPFSVSSDTSQTSSLNPL